ncbi:hypothetical protein GCM10020258_36770 [Sphingomonas yabuuchiae]
MTKHANRRPSFPNGNKGVPDCGKSSKPYQRAPIPNRERPAEPQPFQATKEQLLDFYKQMLLIRRFEEKAGQLYGLGLIGGFCHLYIGQEAVAVGLQSALDGDKDRSSPAIATMATCSPMASIPRSSWPSLACRRHLQGQGRVDAHVLDRA